MIRKAAEYLTTLSQQTCEISTVISPSHRGKLKVQVSSLPKATELRVAEVLPRAGPWTGARSPRREAQPSSAGSAATASSLAAVTHLSLSSADAATPVATPASGRASATSPATPGPHSPTSGQLPATSGCCAGDGCGRGSKDSVSVFQGRFP